MNEIKLLKQNAMWYQRLNFYPQASGISIALLLSHDQDSEKHCVLSRQTIFYLSTIKPYMSRIGSAEYFIAVLVLQLQRKCN